MVADGDLGVEERAGGDDGGALDAAHQGVLKSKKKINIFGARMGGSSSAQNDFTIVQVQ